MSETDDLFSFSQGSLFEGERGLDLENFLPVKLIWAGRKVERWLQERLQSTYDLTIPDWLVLNALMKQDNVSVKQLGPSIHLDTVAVSRATKRLADRELVIKDPNQKDRRLVVLVPTDAGKGVIDEIDRDLKDFEQGVLRKLAKLERKHLGQHLANLSEPKAKR
ncbi:MarR family winged helix-turn-helix transcriptional regulator [Pseudovibrio sp. SPO723]|uniref:MarR family winged helix-turn-helix transcriptional regulator n=1 Tax=Nesiotobacter zosterae TaxID=392721 RepID=UPI0029C5EBE1|nr:MarR family transcriptional regulator [Pseudovibrio sp. SPO723]MDX5593745.1 MarR family transcriptional regulator [Pseudovibrio sp. SPO723]